MVTLPFEEYREAAGKSFQEVVEALDWDPEYLYMVEKGVTFPKLDQAMALAEEIGAVLVLERK